MRAANNLQAKEIMESTQILDSKLLAKTMNEKINSMRRRAQNNNIIHTN
jgi:hypothetical protein